MPLINQTVYPQEFALHRKYAQSDRLLDLVWTHCNIINDIVIELYQQKPKHFQFPLEVAMQAALTHDVGVYLCDGFGWMPDQQPSSIPYAQHTVVSAWILFQEGYLPEVVQVANVHAGVGLTVDDIQSHSLQLPLDNYLQVTQLQKFVSYAAKYHSKTPKFKSIEEIRTSIQHFSDQKLDIFNEYVVEFGQPNIQALTEKYDAWHRAFSYEMEQLTSGRHTGYQSAYKV